MVTWLNGNSARDGTPGLGRKHLPLPVRVRTVDGSSMHQCLYCDKLLYAPLRFCSTKHAALYYRVSDPVAWALYVASYGERKVDWRQRKRNRWKGISSTEMSC